MNTKSMMLGAILIAQTVKSQNNFHKYYLEGQLGTGIQKTMPVAGPGGAFGFFINQNSSLDFRAREIYNLNDKVIVGAISINYRYHFSNGFFVGGGFGHHHELSSDDYMQHPAEAALGTHHNIMHRSGICAEVGYNFKPLAKEGFFSRIYPTSSLILTYMVKDNGYNPLVTANIGIRIGFQKL
ncbi:MAG: hypothetical protein ACXVO9_13525 [Bacteroidia bacterium]